MSGSVAVFRSCPRPGLSFLAFTAGLTLIASACGDGGTGLPAPGGIQITVSTSGPEPDPDGYQVSIDGTSAGPIGINDRQHHGEIQPGTHSVQIDGLAANCSITGNNPRTVTVASGGEAALEFHVTCAGTTGALQVNTSTSGPSPDPDGYSIALDGADQGRIGTSGMVTLAGLPPGAHQVGLGGLAANCTVEGDNPRSVTITAADTLAVGFAIACGDLGVTHWNSIPLPAGFRATSIWASGPSAIFVAGYQDPDRNAVLRFDGQVWIPILATDQRRIFGPAVWGVSPGDLFAVVETNEVLHYDGAIWSNIGPQGSDDISFHAIWGTSGAHLVVGGFNDNGDALLLQLNGTTWGFVGAFGSDGNIRDIAGSSTDIFLVARYFAGPDIDPYWVATGIGHFDGSSFQGDILESRCYYPELTNCYTLKGIWANAGNDVFAVGDRTYHYDGANWSRMTGPTMGMLQDVWGNSGSNVYAVGSKGIFRYDGVRWTRVNDTPGLGVWGTGTDLFVITESAVLHGSR